MLYFLDTSYLIVITHKKDQYHENAVSVSRFLEKPVCFITTDTVLMEYGKLALQWGEISDSEKKLLTFI